MHSDNSQGPHWQLRSLLLKWLSHHLSIYLLTVSSIFWHSKLCSDSFLHTVHRKTVLLLSYQTCSLTERKEWNTCHSTIRLDTNTNLNISAISVLIGCCDDISCITNCTDFVNSCINTKNTDCLLCSLLIYICLFKLIKLCIWKYSLPSFFFAFSCAWAIGFRVISWTRPSPSPAIKW